MKRIFLFLCFPIFVFPQTSLVSDKAWGESEIYNLKGDRELAINILLENIEYLQNNGTEAIFELSSGYNNLGVRYQTYGKWDESAFAYLKAIEYLQGTSEYNFLKSEVYRNLGLLYVKIVDPSADYYLGIAESLALETNNNEVLFVLYKVTSRLKEGIKFAQRIKNNQYLSNYYYLLGNSIDSLSAFYFDSARIILPRLPNSKLQNFQYHAYIVAYFLRLNQLDSALFHCKKAEKVAPLLNDDEVERHYLDCYAKTYLKMGDYKMAWQYKAKSDSVEALYKSPKNLAVLAGINKQRIFFDKELELIELLAQQKIRNIAIFIFLFLFILIYIFIRNTSRLNEKLNQSNKTKDRLFSIISHDLRGSIVALKVLSQTNELASLMKIKEGSESLLLEFDNLLNWSAEHLSKIILHPKTLDLNEIIKETISLLKTQISDKKIDILKEYKEDCIAFADENTIRIVIRNIIHNAIKYSSENSEIRISIEENEISTKIEITDKGCGFEFNHPSKGLGLGLDLCREFMTLNEGEFLIDSSEKGSRVSIVLPNKI